MGDHRGGPPQAYGLAAPGRPIPPDQWAATAEAPAVFAPGAHPMIEGFVCIAPTGRLIGPAVARLKAKAMARPGAFFLPLGSPAVNGLYTVAARLYGLWPGFYVGIVPESNRVTPGSPFRILVVALNGSGEPQSRRLEPAKFPAARSERAKLRFTLAPYSWAANEIVCRAPNTRNKSKRVRVRLRAYHDNNPYAKSLAVALASGGFLVRSPGFTILGVEVSAMDLETVDNARKIRDRCEEIAKIWLQTTEARAVLQDDDRGLSAEQVLAWLREYLTLERVFGGLAQAGWPGAPGLLLTSFLDVEIKWGLPAHA